MKLEKRGSAAPSDLPEEPEKGKKPVVVYIMVLFIAAFLLMAWSFASHQRSNSEALGQLQSSVSAMQEVQATQDKIIELQSELAQAQKSIESLEQSVGESRSQCITLEKQVEGMCLLYRLQQTYAAQDYEACLPIIVEFEDGGYAEVLPSLSGEEVTAPAERYRQLKEAVEAQGTPAG